MSLVTKSALDFTCPALLNNGMIIENFNYKTFINNKLSILFFWPLDFTFVCPSELIALNNRYEQFFKRNVEIIGISIDSVFSHQIWQKMSITEGGIGKLKFVMVSDMNKQIQTYYNVAHPELGISLRATFIIDQNYIIRHESINDLPLGRNIDELIRIIDALIFNSKNGQVCPAQWKTGKATIIPTREGIKTYLSNNINDLN